MFRTKEIYLRMQNMQNEKTTKRRWDDYIFKQDIEAIQAAQQEFLEYENVQKDGLLFCTDTVASKTTAHKTLHIQCMSITFHCSYRFAHLCVNRMFQFDSKHITQCVESLISAAIKSNYICLFFVAFFYNMQHFNGIKVSQMLTKFVSESTPFILLTQQHILQFHIQMSV